MLRHNSSLRLRPLMLFNSTKGRGFYQPFGNDMPGSVTDRPPTLTHRQKKEAGAKPRPIPILPPVVVLWES